MTKGHVLQRLLVAFLPHTLLFLSTLVTTGTYAATMTARVVLIYPVLRVFQEDVTPEMREKMGIPDGVETVPWFTKGTSGKSPGLAKANEWLDRSDRFWVGFFSYDGTAKEKARFGTLCTVLALFLLVAGISAASNFAHIYLRALLVVRILISLRVRLLRNLLRQPLAFYNEQKRGELISRMGADVHGATACLDTMTGPLLHQPLAILMPAALLVAIKWWFGFLVFGFLAAIAFSVRKQTRKVHRRARVRQRTIARVTESMVQMFSGIRVVKAFGLEAAKVDQYSDRNQEFARDAMATERSKAWTRTIMELLTNLMVVLAVAVVLAVLGFGGRLDPAIVLMLLLTTWRAPGGSSSSRT
ncbi:MAG: ABC transporter transmembrane domain-containing protein [Planctomycetota bacterium]|jgi:ABC-type multidrug transport system fused ATPase/permease subunit